MVKNNALHMRGVAVIRTASVEPEKRKSRRKVFFGVESCMPGKRIPVFGVKFRKSMIHRKSEHGDEPRRTSCLYLFGQM